MPPDPGAGRNDMKRSTFLKVILIFALWPTIVLGKKCITSCDQCLRDYECCKIPRTVSSREWAFMDSHLRQGGEVTFEKYKKDFGYTMTGRCAFLTGRGRYKYHDLEDTTVNQCAIYPNRPGVCKQYQCEELKCGFEKVNRF